MGRKKSRRKSWGNVGKKTIDGRQSPEGSRRNGDGTKEEVTKKEGGGGHGSIYTIAPINVYSRLTYPLVRSFVKEGSPSDDDNEEEEEEDAAVEFNFSPRFVFVSTLCAICMERSKVLCEACGMVSYCSSKHKKQGWPRHRDLCKALAEIGSRGAHATFIGQLDAEEYRTYRLKLLGILESEIGRSLELWEREIVLYPRICRICRELSSDGLAYCSACAMEFFCQKHEKEHKEWCKEFQVYRRCLFMQHVYGRVEPRVTNTRRAVPLDLPENFDRLMFDVYGPSAYYCEMDCYTYCTLSHLCTIPLTALYSLQVSRPTTWKTTENLAIHVIGAEFHFECTNLEVWEKFFLHFLPNLKRLVLIFIGPELRMPSDDVPIELLTRMRLCSACKSSDRKVSVFFHPEKFYHQVTPSERFPVPDLICLYNPGLYRETGFDGRDTWPETIREFCKTRVPVTVTSYTKEEIPREIVRIKSISDIDVILEPRRNPFASIKPDRNFVSDDTVPLIYKNYYLTIVKGK